MTQSTRLDLDPIIVLRYDMTDADGSNSGALAAGGDRLSRLGDATLGHILSFLPAVEATRAAALSRRWRHAFPAVHTLSFRESERPLSMGYQWFELCDECGHRDPDHVLPPRLVAGVGAALFGRHRGPRAAAAAVPLRALRVAFDEFGYQGGGVARKAIDGWLSYAAYHAAGDGLEIDLRLDAGEPACTRPYALLPPGLLDAEDGGGDQDLAPGHVIDTDADPGLDDDGRDDQTMDSYYTEASSGSRSPASDQTMDRDDYTDASSGSRSPVGDQTMDGGDDYTEALSESRSPAGDQTMDGDNYTEASTEAASGEPYLWWKAGGGYPIYITPKSLFTCTALRSLRLGSCGLDLPTAIALPSLVTMQLTRVIGRTGAIRRLVAACPRLADLTLEACSGDLIELSVPGGTRLRRLALRCCHDLAAVAVGDSSELRAFEYRGAVPEPEFLTMDGSPRKIKLCTIDLCGQKRAGTPDLGNLMHFIRLFAGVERLHLTSARLGCGIGRGVFSSSALEFPAFPALRNLELTGMLPGDDTAAITVVTRILERTPSLETLSLIFLPEPHPVATNSYMNAEETRHAAHKLRYDRHAALAVPGVDIPCLRERMREINLVHYQGAMAQRMLAKFLLRNALVVNEVWCEFARGPLPIQTKLMGEIKGWVLNKSTKTIFC
ncbi:unnamed protein product [Urochloa decumbens]|uniref:F-box/LRR-repeat protein 15/At3g58940/PEG3-like LRR domain-containing protein n=1 Tax=Urochloa decumbens TaxID=240449 RepID=A0ABC9AYW6_9POAL